MTHKDIFNEIHKQFWDEQKEKDSYEFFFEDSLNEFKTVPFSSKMAEAFGAETLLPVELFYRQETNDILLTFTGLYISNDRQAKYSRLISRAKKFVSGNSAEDWAINNGYFIVNKN